MKALSEHRFWILLFLIAGLLLPSVGFSAEPPGILLGNRVKLTVKPFKIKRASGEATAKATLVNRSKQTLYGPLSVLVTSTKPAGVLLAGASGQNAAGQQYLSIDLPASGLVPRKRPLNFSLRFQNLAGKKLKATYAVYGLLSPNSKPVANAGADRTAFVGDPIVLDGSGSTDADGQSLAYRWSLIAKPPASTAALSVSEGLRSGFTIDLPGDYRAQLVVNDGIVDSAPDEVRISTENSRPVAKAGPDQTVTSGSTVNLDGSQSSDIDGDALSFAWTLINKPGGSGSALSAAETAFPSFKIDRGGRYEIQLVVSDGKVQSTPDTVLVDTRNSAPVAKPTVSGSFRVGETILLDGSGSSDVDQDPLSYRWSLATLPTGAGDLAPACKTLGGDPVCQFQPNMGGDYVAQLIVNDGKLDSQPKTAGFKVEPANPPANRAPEITTQALTTATAGQPYNYDVDATDADGDTLTYSLTQSPAGMTIDATGSIQWATPTAGSHDVTVLVQDGRGGQASQPFTLVVNAPGNRNPVITTQALTAAAAGQAYSYDVDASDADGDSLTFSLTQAPAGMTIDATGLIQWATPTAGSHDVTVQVDDGHGGQAGQAFTLVVNAPGNRNPQFTTQAPTGAAAGQLYSYDADAADADGDNLTYSLTQSPGGMTIDPASGLIQWTPTSGQGGDHPVTVRVADGKGGTADQTFTVTVAAGPNHHPAITSQPVLTGLAGQTYLYQVTATDEDGDTLTYSLAEKPAGMTIDGATGSIQWPAVNTVAGVYHIALKVEDGRGGLAEQGFNLTISAQPNQAPQITTQPDTTATVGEAYAYDVNADDANGDTLVYGLTVSPEGMTIDGPTGLVQWIPGAGQIGSHPVTVRVRDTQGGETTQGFDLVVTAAPNQAPVFSSIPVAAATAGQPYVYNASATDADGDTVTFGLSAAPAGMTLDAASGLVQWTPAADATGTRNVAIRVQDGKGGQSVQSFSIVLTVPGLVPGVTGLPRAAAVTALQEAGLVVGTVTPIHHPSIADGLVLSQSIAAGSPASPGATVNLTVSLGPDLGLPPNPATVAPPADPTVAATTFDSTQFLYSGSTPVQTGVAEGTIAPKRAAVIRGRVLNRQNQSLPRVRVSIAGHPEFGETETRTDGRFDLAVNGGGWLTVNFAANGYLTAQRTLQVPWQDFALVEDVVLLPVDGRITAITLGSNQLQAAEGNAVTDGEGTRRTLALFPAGTQAHLAMPDGSSVPLSVMHVRSTEFTVGGNGQNTMPGELPGASGYTYAMELSVDEAQNAGAKSVEFDRDVVFYVDNFLNFPVGMTVPVGYLDRDKAAWVPSANGRIVKIVEIRNGLAEIDTDGNGSADNDPSLGLTEAERAEIAAHYAAGKTLWRVAVRHFTPWDCNWPYGPPDDAEPPEDVDVGSGGPGDDDPCTSSSSGSIIECESQVLGETVPLTGTPFTLNYRTSRMPGRTGGRGLTVTVRDRTLPPSLKRIDVVVTVAGREFSRSVAPTGNKKVRFEWDGLNVYGQAQQGGQNVQVKVGYAYEAVYLSPAGFQAAFSRLAGVPIQGSRARQEVILWKEGVGKLTTWDAGKNTLGGWTLSAHHSYDPVGRKLYMGDGSVRNEDFMAPVIDIAAGTGAQGFSGDGGKAADAKFRFPREIATGPDGSLYIADSGNNRVRKVAPDGTVTTLAGNGNYGFGGDGGPATEASLRFPRGLAVGKDGSIYVADFLNYRVRKIDPNGIITTFAGNGQRGYGGDDGPATQASFDGVENIAIGKDGVVYLSDTGNHRIRIVGADGLVTTAAGDGTAGFSGDGGPASAARVSAPRGIAVDENGILYFADSGNARVRRIGTDGRIATFAGNGKVAYSGDGGPAAEASLGVLRGLTITRGGSVCVSDFSNHRVRCVGTDGRISTAAGNGGTAAAKKGMFATQTPLEYPRSISFAPDGGFYVARENANQIVHATRALPGFDGGDIAIASEDGSLLYRFDQNGRHLSTLNGLTGATLLNFGYDARDRLLRIEDAFGNATTVERNGEGVPTAILGPFGQRNELAFDNNGYLKSVANPAAETFSMAYTNTGLLTEFKNPRGYASTFAYDDNGRLVKDTNAAGGYQALALTELATGHEVARTTALGRKTLYRTENLATGGFDKTLIFPDGTWQKTRIGTDRSTSAQTPDGSTAETTPATDPRFASARYPARTQVSTSGHTLLATTEQTAALTDPANPFSLTSLVQKTTVNGRLFNSTYNAATRTIANATPGGRQNQTVLDALGRTVQTQVAGILPVVNGYDVKGRLTTVTQGSGVDQRALGYAYNALGYLESATDPLGRKVSFEYNLAGLVTRQTLPDGREIAFTYDQNGNLASLTPPGRPAHVFRHTSIDLNDQYAPPDVGAGTHHTIYDYNLDQQLTRITRPDGLTLDYTYDAGGRLSRLTVPDGYFDLTYDGATGRPASLTAPDMGTLDYTYSGALLTEITWSGAVAGSVQYGYDDDLRLASVGLNGANTVGYEYDADSLLTKAGALGLTRNAQNGLLTGTTLGNVKDSFVYSSFGEVTIYEAKYNTSPLLKAEYTRDKLGRTTRKKETVGVVSHTYDYGYDTAGRLIQVKKDGAEISAYAYDTNGNRISHTTPGGTATGTYDDQDRLLSYAGTTYTYTANGELKTKTVGTAVTGYEYDVLGNLKHVDLPGGTMIDYLTDGQSRRIGKKVNGALVQGFLWQDSLKPIAELDGSGNVVSRFVYATGVNVPDYILKGGATYRVVTDHLGSPRLIVDVATNTVAQELDYDEFGKVILDTNPGFQPFGFAGGLYDRDTGLSRFGSRDYDSHSGRWVAKDPILFFGRSSNLYDYVLGDPINFTDANGRIVPLIVAGAGVGALIGTAVYLGNAWITGGPVTAGGVLGAAASGAIAGGIGVVATPIAGALGLGTGVLGTAAVNAGAGVLGTAVGAALDPCTDITPGGLLAGGLAGGAGGYLGGRFFPTRGMSNFRQVGFPRTWPGVTPSFLGGRMGINATNAIYTGGSVSGFVGASGPTVAGDLGY